VSRYRIVLADDHAMMRQGLRKIMEGVADLEVIGEAGDGIELLALLERVIPHMVILDISMPNLRGIEALRQIKMKYPEVKVLILSMHKEYLYQGFSAGADGYLLKEDADRELFSAIENIRQGRTYLSPRLTGRLLEDRAPSSEGLSVREKEVLRLIVEGKSNKEIAEILFISVRTVESHRANVMAKLNLNSTADLVKYAIQKGYA
jgi:DNA-binding NarL/FixJ family response regulator